MIITTILLLIPGLLLVDFAMPFVYVAWRFDRSINTAQMKGFRARYGLVAVPRTILLLALAGAIVFAPSTAANDILYLSVFVGLALAYGANCLFDLIRAFSAAKTGR